MRRGGGADFSAVTEDILPATDDTFDIGSPARRWSEGHFSDFLKIGTDPYWQIFADGRLRLETPGDNATRIDIGFDGPGNEGFHWINNDIAGLSRIHIDYNDGQTELQLNGPGAASFQVGVQLDSGYITAADAGNERFRCLWWEAGVLDLRFDDLPATDPAAAAQIFTMNSAGLAAALAAGARYVLISGGP